MILQWTCEERNKIPVEDKNCAAFLPLNHTLEYPQMKIHILKKPIFKFTPRALFEEIQPLSSSHILVHFNA